MMMFRRKAWINSRIWFKIAGLTLLLVALGLVVHLVRANIYPDYLRNGRTYDQETGYIQWNGSVAFISLYHKDNTSLPPSEGGASCGNGCTDIPVTTIGDLDIKGLQVGKVAGD